jgi:hypothetical protein
MPVDARLARRRVMDQDEERGDVRQVDEGTNARDAAAGNLLGIVSVEDRSKDGRKRSGLPSRRRSSSALVDR